MSDSYSQITPAYGWHYITRQHGKIQAFPIAVWALKANSAEVIGLIGETTGGTNNVVHKLSTVPPLEGMYKHESTMTEAETAAIAPADPQFKVAAAEMKRINGQADSDQIMAGSFCKEVQTQAESNLRNLQKIADEGKTVDDAVLGRVASITATINQMAIMAEDLSEFHEAGRLSAIFKSLLNKIVEIRKAAVQLHDSLHLLAHKARQLRPVAIGDQAELQALRKAVALMGFNPTKLAVYVASEGDDVCKQILLSSMDLSEDKLRKAGSSNSESWRTILANLRID